MPRQRTSLSAFDVVTTPYPEGIPIWGDNDPTAQIDAREMNVTAEASMFVDTGLIDWPQPERQMAVQERFRPQARRFPPPVPLRRSAGLDRKLAARRAAPPSIPPDARRLRGSSRPGDS